MDYTYNIKKNADMILGGKLYDNKGATFSHNAPVKSQHKKDILINTYHNNYNDIELKEKEIQANINIINSSLSNNKKIIQTKQRRLNKINNENKFNSILNKSNELLFDKGKYNIDSNLEKTTKTESTKYSKHEPIINKKYEKEKDNDDWDLFDSSNKDIDVKKEDVKVKIPPVNTKKNKINEGIKEVIKEIETLEDELISCPEGCGRKFNPNALKKHKKICKSVFKTKPKKPKQAPIPSKPKKQNNWKKESEKFRGMLKQLKDLDINNDEEFDL